MKKDFLEGLEEMISIQSISTDERYKPEINRMVRLLKEKFEGNQFDVKILEGRKTNPIIFASHQVSDSVETILIYGHYDVQPADKDNGWIGDPFHVTEKNGRLYARGIVDNKGQFWIHMYQIFQLIISGKLKYNIKFLIEGNEETSNDELPALLKENQSLFEADHILVSDGEVIGDNPVIETSLRGGFSVRIVYRTAKNNVHSGIFGGAVPNSAYELSKFVADLYDRSNMITIPGFYENVDGIREVQIENNIKLTHLSEVALKEVGFTTLLTEPGNDFFTQIGLRPTIEVSGFKSGYIDEGFANIIPAVAEVKLNFRIVPSQTAKETKSLFRNYVNMATPKYIDFALEFVGLHDPVKIDTRAPIVSVVKKELEKSYGKEVLMKPVGGAIPVVSDFKKYWGVETLLVSLGNDDCNMHGANENFRIDLIEKGLDFSKRFFSV